MTDHELLILLWRAGALVPYRITKALDWAGLQGPEVDRLCEAAEPEVDEWEAGTRYPRLVQVRALAELTGVHPLWFFRTTDQDTDRLTSPVFVCGPGGCNAMVDDGVEYVLTYPIDVVRATVGDD
ncbi:hypothetical protein [Aeromicrobium endophyticum]|uniref:hypothetical protein n=1 Tax=Aeromicrobium endophyticum TaxID=2292704 RepID=UPI0011C366EB|nr:hypothetical protein [Aeromicrobium endophyticum]